MDISASEWSSGCESGWTVYLDDSYPSPSKYQASVLDDHHHQQHQSYRSNTEYEEDLSMVSDASSGPPHFHYGVTEEEEVECYREGARISSSSSEKSKKKKKAKEPRNKNQHSFLDDTASSPNVNRCTDPSSNQQFFGYSKENGFMGNSAYVDQFGHWLSSHPKQQDSTESRRSRARRTN